MITEDVPFPAPPFRGDQLRGRQLTRQPLDASLRIDAYVAIAAVLRVKAKGPFKEVAPCRAARQPDSVQLQEVRELREVDTFVGGVECGGRPDAQLSERRHPILEPRRAAVHRCGRVGHLQTFGDPQDRAPQVVKAVRVDASGGAVEVPFELAADA